jgi:GTP-binding protein
MNTRNVRNVAIIAHVDHGKTTLVDELLKAAGAFREDQVIEERVMDNDDLEKERGITILSKNASMNYKEHRINIVDTPGHADFGGQVERVLGTVDGVLLVVDAFEGPMAQTRFVTQKALALGLRPIIVVNKIDRDGCQPELALDKVFDLFCELDATEEQLEFPHIYASARNGICRLDMSEEDQNLCPLLDMIIAAIPGPKDTKELEPLLQISSLEYSEFMGQLAVGRLEQGYLKIGSQVSQSRPDGTFKNSRIQKIFRYDGISLTDVQDAEGGDIILIAGLNEFDIGDTLSSLENPIAHKRISIDPPTIAMNFGVNTSPIAGKDGGKYLTGTHLLNRLERAQLADPALHVENVGGASSWLVSGRGVLHLTILIENMRRESYEFTVGAPQVIFKKDENGKVLEPIERFKVEVPQEFSGAVIEELGRRKGQMINMEQNENQCTVEYTIPSRGLIGIRNILLSLSKGYAVSQSIFEGYEHQKGEIPSRRSGTLISKDNGQTTGYSLSKMEDRGDMFVPPGVDVYSGMIVGECNRNTDIIVNVTKGKQLTNVRASGTDDNLMLSPHRVLSLEECITFINTDEAVEVTPESLRLRKLELQEHARKQTAKILQDK